MPPPPCERFEHNFDAGTQWYSMDDSSRVEIVQTVRVGQFESHAAKPLCLQCFHCTRFPNTPRERFELFAEVSALSLDGEWGVRGEKCSNRSQDGGECLWLENPSGLFSPTASVSCECGLQCFPWFKMPGICAGPSKRSAAVGKNGGPPAGMCALSR